MEKIEKYINFLNENIKPMSVPDDIESMSKLFKKSGKDLYIVGGACRDFLMGKIPHDYDLVTDALPEESKEILKNWNVSDVQGKKHGILRIYTKNEPLGYELAVYRFDIAKGRHNKGDDQKVEIGRHIGMKEDSQRRDFSINSLYYDIHNKKMIDLVGGIKDIKDNNIRAVGVPQQRFEEDRLRIIRCLRFAAVTGGKIDKMTSAAIIKDNRLFGISEEDDVSRERIFAEFLKVKEKSQENQDAGIITRFIDLLIDYNILYQILPVMVINKTITPTEFLTVALAQTLRNNHPTEKFKKILIDAKIPNTYVDTIAFLLKIYHVGVNEDTVYDYYREMSSKSIRTDILQEWIRVMGIVDDMVITFLKYHPATSGGDVMKDGFKGPEIGAEIKRREGIRFLNMVKGVNEKINILKINDFLK